MKKVIVASALLGSLFAVPALAAPVVSEDFNSGFGAFTVDSTTIGRDSARPTYQTCCGVTGSDAALDNPFVAFGGGNVNDQGSIFTEFSTLGGFLYTLTFRAGAFGAGTTNLNYSVGGISGALNLVANNNVDTTFNPFTFTFAGTGGVTRLSFSSLGAGTNVDAVLDDVSVAAAVPEPATWGMMILGFGAMGVAMRRRAKVRTNVSYA